MRKLTQQERFAMGSGHRAVPDQPCHKPRNREAQAGR